MKNTIKFIAACALFAGASGSFAGGSHAGGHTHEHGHEHGAGHDGEEIGKPGVAANVTRTVNVDMADAMRFSPDDIQVKQGETIRFVVKNSGALRHEFVLGTTKDLKEHYELMKKFPEMEHAEANQITVNPGQTGEVIWHFTKAVKVDFACLHPGHYDAGMKGAVSVTSSGGSQGAMAPEKMAAANAPATVQISSADMTEGEVRKIDIENKKITIKHGEIKNLDMPGMTMVFQVKDAALLDTVKAGDKIHFKAEKAGGALVVMAIEAAK
jgi:uncharacterized cupredoxin-like copper-binding protein/Cu/Ag efflux protein CusF